MKQLDMKQLDVQIMGQSYLLSCPLGGESRLLDAVARVDSAMCKIRDAGKVRARDRIAVLAALNLAFDLNPSASGNGAEQVQAAAAASGTNEAAGQAALSDTDLARVTTLLARLDAALGEDGRLL